jgi:hypothetical protein
MVHSVDMGHGKIGYAHSENPGGNRLSARNNLAIRFRGKDTSASFQYLEGRGIHRRRESVERVPIDVAWLQFELLDQSIHVHSRPQRDDVTGSIGGDCHRGRGLPKAKDPKEED